MHRKNFLIFVLILIQGVYCQPDLPSTLYNKILVDDFELAEGPMNPDYYFNYIFPPYMPTVEGGKACNDDIDAIVFFMPSKNSTSDDVRISFDYILMSTNGSNVYAATSYEGSNYGTSPPVIQGGCTYTQIDSPTCAVQLHGRYNPSIGVSSLTIRQYERYRFVVTFSNQYNTSISSVVAYDSKGNVLDSLLGTLQRTIAIGPYGVVVGYRGYKSCFDNLVVETGGYGQTLAGCNGNISGICSTTIINEDGYHVGANVSMSPNTDYQMQVFIRNTSYIVTIRSAYNGSLLSNYTVAGSYINFNQFGVTMGNVLDGNLTCIDNFRIETVCTILGTPNITAVFYDSFDRPNGPVGPNYLSDDYLPAGMSAPSIYNNKLCGDGKSMAIYLHTVISTNVILSWTFRSQSNNGFETYGVGILPTSNPQPLSNTGTTAALIFNGDIAAISNWPQFLNSFQLSPIRRVRTKKVVASSSTTFVVGIEYLDLPVVDDSLTEMNNLVENPSQLNISGFSLLSASILEDALEVPYVVWVNQFADFFNSTLNSRYFTLTGPVINSSLPTINSTSTSICGDNNNIALFNLTGITDNVQITFDWYSTRPNYQIFAMSVNDSQNPYIIGCNGSCKPEIGIFSKTTNYGSSISLSPYTKYHMKTAFYNSQGLMTFELYTSDQKQRLGTFKVNRNGVFLNPFGFFLNGTCLTNLRVDTGPDSIAYGGCNGKLDSYCIPTIFTSNATIGTPIPFAVNTSYNMTMDINSDFITVHINSVMISKTVNPGNTYNKFGIMMGRVADYSVITCVDDFSIQVNNSGTFSNFFSDNFNRANGIAGNYSRIPNTYMPFILNNSLCGQAQSAAVYNTSVNLSGVSGIRISWTFKSTSTSGFDSYGLAVNTLTSLSTPLTAPGSTFSLLLRDPGFYCIRDPARFGFQASNDVANALGIDQKRVVLYLRQSTTIISFVYFKILEVGTYDSAELVAKYLYLIRNGTIQTIAGSPITNTSPVTTGTTGIQTSTGGPLADSSTTCTTTSHKAGSLTSTPNIMQNEAMTSNNGCRHFGTLLSACFVCTALLFF